MQGKIKHGEAEASHATESRSFPKDRKLRMLPTLREKRHYLVLTSDESCEDEIKKAILDFIGTLGYAKAGVFFVEQDKVNHKQTYFIISVVTKYVDQVKASIALMKKPRARCIGVSGTIKKAKEKFLSGLIKC